MLLLVLLLLVGCTNLINNYFNKRDEKYLVSINETIHVNNCDCNKAKSVADSLFENHFKFNIKEYDEIFSNNDTCYIFELHSKQIKSYIYSEPKVKGEVYGGGGKLTISKKTCKVLKILL